MRNRLAITALVVTGAIGAGADETDQYLSWNTELADAAPALNDFIAAQAAEVIARINAQPPESCTCETITQLIFAAVYLDRFRAPVFEYIEESGLVDVYPPRDVPPDELLDRSVYRDVTLPSIIRVTRTVRIGDVYLGVDKLAHLFGIGRRYYVRYRDAREEGASFDDAVDEAIRWGIFTEDSILGRVVNGIFSHADLEANYAGLRLAIAFCEGDSPYLRQGAAGWVLQRPVNLTELVSPLFDESFNPNHFTGSVLDAVLPVLREEYRRPALLQRAGARFARYGDPEPTRSTRTVAVFFEENAMTSQHGALLEALGLSDTDAAAPIDALRIGAH